jgi:hypothetical protein
MEGVKVAIEVDFELVAKTQVCLSFESACFPYTRHCGKVPQKRRSHERSNLFERDLHGKEAKVPILLRAPAPTPL